LAPDAEKLHLLNYIFTRVQLTEITSINDFSSFSGEASCKEIVGRYVLARLSCLGCYGKDNIIIC
jgi:hypothetical protein